MTFAAGPYSKVGPRHSTTGSNGSRALVLPNQILRKAWAIQASTDCRKDNRPPGVAAIGPWRTAPALEYRSADSAARQRSGCPQCHSIEQFFSGCCSWDIAWRFGPEACPPLISRVPQEEARGPTSRLITNLMESRNPGRRMSKLRASKLIATLRARADVGRTVGQVFRAKAPERAKTANAKLQIADTTWSPTSKLAGRSCATLSEDHRCVSVYRAFWHHTDFCGETGSSAGFLNEAVVTKRHPARLRRVLPWQVRLCPDIFWPSGAERTGLLFLTISDTYRADDRGNNEKNNDKQHWLSSALCRSIYIGWLNVSLSRLAQRSADAALLKKVIWLRNNCRNHVRDAGAG